MEAASAKLNEMNEANPSCATKRGRIPAALALALSFILLFLLFLQRIDPSDADSTSILPFPSDSRVLIVLAYWALVGVAAVALWKIVRWRRASWRDERALMLATAVAAYLVTMIVVWPPQQHWIDVGTPHQRLFPWPKKGLSDEEFRETAAYQDYLAKKLETFDRSLDEGQVSATALLRLAQPTFGHYWLRVRQEDPTGCYYFDVQKGRSGARVNVCASNRIAETSRKIKAEGATSPLGQHLNAWWWIENSEMWPGIETTIERMVKHSVR